MFLNQTPQEIQRVRLLVFIKSLSGGAGKAATQYARVFSELNFNVTIVAGRADLKISSMLPKNLSLKILGMRGRMPPIISLSEAIRHIRPHIALVIGMGNGLPFNFALRLAGKTCIVIHREVNAPHAMLSQHSRLRRAIELRMGRFAYERADHIICLTRAMYRELSDDWHIPANKLHLIYNGVDIPTKDSGPRELHEPPDILCVGRLSDQKDIPTLLQAFAVLRRRQQCRLKIVGEGENRAHLEALTAELGIASDVTFLGQVDNPIPLYREAHVTVLSSVFEGFPNTLIESLAQGCPIVATDCPTGPAEVIDSAEVGYLAQMGNPEDLARQLERALLRNFDINKLRARAEFFSEERLKCRIHKLSDKVLHELESRENWHA